MYISIYNSPQPRELPSLGGVKLNVAFIFALATTGFKFFSSRLRTIAIPGTTRLQNTAARLLKSEASTAVLLGVQFGGAGGRSYTGVSLSSIELSTIPTIEIRPSSPMPGGWAKIP